LSILGAAATVGIGAAAVANLLVWGAILAGTAAGALIGWGISSLKKTWFGR